MRRQAWGKVVECAWSYLAAPVPPERVLLALLVSKAADVCPLHFSELVLEAGARARVIIIDLSVHL